MTLEPPSEILCQNCIRRAPQLLIRFTASPRYNLGNWCSRCQALYPFDLWRCPCCGQTMRRYGRDSRQKEHVQKNRKVRRI